MYGVEGGSQDCLYARQALDSPTKPALFIFCLRGGLMELRLASILPNVQCQCTIPSMSPVITVPALGGCQVAESRVSLCPGWPQTPALKEFFCLIQVALQKQVIIYG